DVTGTRDLGNTGAGVSTTVVRDNTIGGTAPGAGNLIAANKGGGILLGEASTNNRVEGNRIGTDVTGRVALGNTGAGISLASDAANDTIGGTAAGAGNVIAGNTGQGVDFPLGAVPSTGSVVQGNFIGTDATGALDLGNGANGVRVASANN